jgi:hypothetical protein
MAKKNASGASQLSQPSHDKIPCFFTDLLFEDVNEPPFGLLQNGVLAQFEYV